NRSLRRLPARMSSSQTCKCAGVRALLLEGEFLELRVGTTRDPARAEMAGRRILLRGGLQRAARRPAGGGRDRRDRLRVDRRDGPGVQGPVHGQPLYGQLPPCAIATCGCTSRRRGPVGSTALTGTWCRGAG